jgi:plastocyanin
MHRISSALRARVARALIPAGSTGSASSSASSASSSASSSSSSSSSPGARPYGGGSGGLKPTTTPKYGAPAPGAPIRSGVVQVSYRNITIAPDAIRVKVGSTIKWTNSDTIEHNVTSESGPQRFASKNFGEGGTFEIKALRPGVIHYQCTIHPASMNGTIEVVA